MKGFDVAYPTASGQRPFWNVSGQLPGKPDDVGYLRRVIAALTGPAGCADAAHVGITGVSNGGGMTARMACEAADLLAAAAPVAGGYSSLPASGRVAVRLSEGVRTLGFVTQEDLGFLALEGNVAVYLPFAYSMAGSLVIVPSSSVERLAADSASVMALVVSGGVSRAASRS